MKKIRVAAAFVWRRKSKEPEILLLKRPRDVNEVLSWENPGGKIEEGETPIEAVLREIEEEAGVTANDLIDIPVAPFHVHDFVYPDKTCQVFTYLVQVSTNFRPSISDEHLGLTWANRNELRELPMLSGMGVLMPMIDSFLYETSEKPHDDESTSQ